MDIDGKTITLPKTDYSSDDETGTQIHYYETEKLSISSYIGLIQSRGVWDGETRFDYIAVRKYAENELTTTVEQVSTNVWKITINNPNDEDLVDFQIKIDGTGIVESETDSLLITDTISNENIAVDILQASNETGFVELRIYNYSQSKYFIINWDDGTTDNITALENETIVSHTYDLLHLIKPTITAKITGYNNTGSIITTKTVELNIIYPFDKFLNSNYYEIRIANPYNENISNYDLKLTLTGDNFNFWDANLKPLGTNIYFRDENQYLKHYISYFSQAEAQAEIHINIPYIAPNSYKSIYLAFAENDVPQYTFTGDNRTLLYIIIPHNPSQQPVSDNGSLIMKSADINNFKNITVLFVDENSLIAGCTKSGIIQFIDDKGNRVVYTFNSPSLATVQVSAETENGTIMVSTSDGIVRKVRYSDASGFANVVLLPNYVVAPLYCKGEGSISIKTGGFDVTKAEAPCTIALAIGQTYDIYIDGNYYKTITMTEPATIAAISQLSADNVIIYSDIKVLDNATVEHTITASVDAKIVVKNDTNTILEQNIPANVKTVITAPAGAKYEIYVNNTLIKSGTYESRDLGLLITLKDWLSEKWYMILAAALVLFTLWAGTWISAHVAIMLATFEILLFAYIDVFKFDPISKTIILILAVLMFIIMWMKR